MSAWTAKAHNLRATQAAIVADIIRSIYPDDPTTRDRIYRTTAGGDERKLRGIPAIGRGVQGAQPGLRPGDEARRAEANATRIW